MSSFSRQTKIEILKQEIEDDSVALAFLSGLVLSCGEISKKDKRIYIKIISDVQELFPFCKKLVKRFYGDEVEPEVSVNYQINKNTFYEISFDIEKFKTLLSDIGVLNSANEVVYNFKIDRNLILEEDARRAFIKGVFIGSSTSSIKLSSDSAVSCGSGYHLEFVSSNHDFLLDFSSILAEYNFIGKIFERKNSFVFYMKDVNTIQDVLALVGANESFLNLTNEIVTRELRNKVNRQVNCINANINKTVEASIKQTIAINNIQNTIGLDALTDDLQEVAMLRLANPEESLDELLKLSTIKLTRSGLNHRFRKLIKISNTLED